MGRSPAAAPAAPAETPETPGGSRPGSGDASLGGDSAAALAQALVTLYAELDGVYGEAARWLGLTPQQARLLCMCEHGPPSMGDLAGLLDCDKTNVTGLVDRVAKRDLVTRGAHRGDRRVTRVALTPQGAELVERFRRDLDSRLRERLARWPAGRRRRLAELAAAAARDLA